MSTTLHRDDDLDEAAAEPRRGRGRRLAWLALGVVLLGGAAAGAWYWQQRSSGDPAPEAAGPASTAEVTLGSIAATQTWEGTLGHGSPFTVSASAAGTITRLAAPGAAVERGTALYHVDEQPVTVLIGLIPMYRDLGPGDTGVDVEQLEANLVALGYDGFTADDEYTGNTADAVEEWQEDVGAAETGTVAAAGVVFLPEPGLVDGLHAVVGGAVQPGTAVLDLTGADQVVGFEVEVDDRDLVAPGTAVTVGLAGGQQVAGTVTAATVVAAEPADSGGTGGGAGGTAASGAAADDTVAEVDVALAEPVGAELIGSPVDVTVPVDERTDVLLVPVNALLALSEGGYGLEVVHDDGTTSVVAVEAGLFADGRVEVTGEGIAEGTVVGVAGR